MVTKDGYILEMHRIPKKGAQPVLLMHGILDTSATWVLMGPKSGLGKLFYRVKIFTFTQKKDNIVWLKSDFILTKFLALKNCSQKSKKFKH